MSSAKKILQGPSWADTTGLCSNTQNNYSPLLQLKVQGSVSLHSPGSFSLAGLLEIYAAYFLTPGILNRSNRSFILSPKPVARGRLIFIHPERNFNFRPQYGERTQ